MDIHATAAAPIVSSVDTASLPEMKELVRVLTAVRDGDFTVHLPVEWTGTMGKVADLFNDVVRANLQAPTC